MGSRVVSTPRVKDVETGTIFDDYVYQDKGDEYDTDAWTQVCESCAQKHHLLDSYLEIGAAPAGTTCGVLGCHNEAEHYYDFKIAGEITMDMTVKATKLIQGKIAEDKTGKARSSARPRKSPGRRSGPAGLGGTR
jgi:hypothetical protein